jgi:hypothetical protein
MKRLIFANMILVLAGLTSAANAGCLVEVCTAPDGHKYCCQGQAPNAIDEIIYKASLSHGPGFSCQSSPGLGLEDSVTMNFADGVYHITHFGHSRNSFSADYKVISESQTRIGSKAKLSKISDQSTWKDMPELLELESEYLYASTRAPKLFYILSGLVESLLTNGTIWFDESDCQKVTSQP